MVMPAEKARKISENRLSWWGRWRNKRHKLNVWSTTLENIMYDMKEIIQEETKNGNKEATVIVNHWMMYNKHHLIVAREDIFKLNEEEKVDVLESAVRATENQLRDKGYRVEQETAMLGEKKQYYITARW